MDSFVAMTSCHSFLDLTTNWTPAEEDFELAKADVEDNQLDYNFKSVEEIYLTDGSPSSHSIEIIYQKGKEGKWINLSIPHRLVRQ